MNAPATRNLLSLKRHADAPDGAPVFEERLHKVLASAGLGSLRRLEYRIRDGEIRLNAQVAEVGASVRAGDRVEIDNKLFVVVNDSAERAQVLVYNKPEGVVTTREDPKGRPTIFEGLPPLKTARWVSVGRLDINTTGLLLLTTDGKLAHALMHPSTAIEREYICRIHGEVTDGVLEKLRAGVELEDGPARFDELAVVSRGDSHSWFRVTLREGRNREVRRLWESQNLMVSRLKRIRYGNLELPRGLLRGQNEPLDPEAVKTLRLLAGAGDAEPSLTVVPVINQRRAKPANEYRPVLQSQAWSGELADEARELRAFDRIRDDGPMRFDGKRKKNNNKKNDKNRKNPKKRDGQNARQARPGSRQNASRPGGKSRAGQTQIGVYQPPARTWFAGEERPQRGNGNDRRPNGQQKRDGRNQNRSAFVRNENNAPTGNRLKPRHNDNRSRDGYGNRAAHGQSLLRQDEAFPRDDIGNRLPPEDRRGRPPRR